MGARPWPKEQEILGRLRLVFVIVIKSQSRKDDDLGGQTSAMVNASFSRHIIIC